MGEVVIHGQITGWDEREIRGGRTIVTLTVTDYTDTIHVKVFAKDEADLKALQEKVSKGMFVKIRGLSTQGPAFDNELNIGTVWASRSLRISVRPAWTEARSSGWSSTAIRR